MIIQTYSCTLHFSDQLRLAEEKGEKVKWIDITQDEKRKIVCTFCFAEGVPGVSFAHCKVERDVPDIE